MMIDTGSLHAYSKYSINKPGYRVLARRPSVLMSFALWITAVAAIIESGSFWARVRRTRIVSFCTAPLKGIQRNSFKKQLISFSSSGESFEYESISIFVITLMYLFVLLNFFQKTLESIFSLRRFISIQVSKIAFSAIIPFIPPFALKDCAVLNKNMGEFSGCPRYSPAESLFPPFLKPGNNRNVPPLARTGGTRLHCNSHRTFCGACRKIFRQSHLYFPVCGNFHRLLYRHKVTITVKEELCKVMITAPAGTFRSFIGRDNATYRGRICKRVLCGPIVTMAA